MSWPTAAIYLSPGPVIFALIGGTASEPALTYDPDWRRNRDYMAETKRSVPILSAKG